MEPFTASEIHVFPQLFNAKSSPPAPSISGNNFNLEINLLVNHSYTSGEDIIEEYNFGTKWAGKYKSLSWDIIDRVQNVTPFQDDETVDVSLIFVKHVSVSPQEFELTKARIVATQYENRAHRRECDKIKGLGHDSSLYEEFQWLERYIEENVRKTAYWAMYFDENYERELLQSLIEQARGEFRSLPAVRSTMQFLQRVHLPENELTDVCSICMERYLPGSSI